MSTYVSKTYQSNVSNSIEDVFVPQETSPPDTGNWAFVVWSAGGQNVAGSTNKIELFWDASGIGSNMTLIDAIYTAGETYQHELDQTNFYTVDNVGRFVVRRSVLGVQTSREIYAQVQGFVA